MRLLLSAHPDGLVVGEIGEDLGIPGSTLSHHLEKLKNEDLVRVHRERTFLRYSANSEALKDLLASLGCGNPMALAQFKRFAVSDVVVRGEIPVEIRRNVELWVGCLSGALDESDYLARLKRAGFEEVSIEPTRVYKVEDAKEFLSGHGFDVDAIAPLVDGRFFSGFIRAQKPASVPQPA
jgi:hypothetical protein